MSIYIYIYGHVLRVHGFYRFDLHRNVYFLQRSLFEYLSYFKRTLFKLKIIMSFQDFFFVTSRIDSKKLLPWI